MKSSKNKIAINAISSVTQVVITGLVYFILYRYLIEALGIKQLGVWAIVISTTSITNLANYGITSGLVKHVADYHAQNKTEKVPGLIFTALITVSAFFITMIIIVYVAALFFIDLVIEKEFVTIALSVLPFSLINLFINAIGGTFTSTLEGIQKNYLRNILYIISTVAFVVFTFILVKQYKLLGVAYAQIIQALIILVVSYILVKREFPKFSLFQWQWENIIFKQLFAYSTKFQAMLFLQMLCEPITKALLSKFGGLSVVGFYEMASRLVNQVRGLVVNANQVMIPVFAAAAHKNFNELKTLYHKNFSYTILVAAPLMSALIVGGSVISKLWIGHSEAMFLYSLYVLSASTFINIAATPAYFASLGEGKLKLPLINHIIMTTVNLVAGYILGKLFNGNGVILAWGISLICSGTVMIILYQKSILIRFNSSLTLNDGLLILVSIAICILSMAYSKTIIDHFSIITTIIATGFLFLFVYAPVVVFNRNFRSIFLKS